MRQAVHELLLSGDVDAAAVSSALSERFEVTVEAPASAERELMDSFDGLLHSAGAQLERDADGRLRLRAADGTTLAAPAAGNGTRSDRVLAAELPPGPLRERLAGLLDIRAALPLAQVKSRIQSLRALNEDGKTVVRLELEQPELRRDGETAALRPRVRAIGVRGYDVELEQALEVLQGPLALEPAPVPLFDEAVAATGHPPEGVSTKVSVELTRGMRADAATLEVCRRLAGVIEANLPGTVADLDPEFLHDLRVSVRRTRSMLREMRGVLPPAERARARDDLKWVQAITGRTRDLDVHLEEWPDMVRDLPGPVVADLEPIRALLERRRDEAFRDMRRQLRGARYRAAWGRWKRLLDRPLNAEDDSERPNAARPVEEVAGERIRSVYRKMVREGAAIGADTPAEALHDLRKRGKELRYLLELFGGLWPAEEVRPLISTLKDLQGVLGRFQDREVQGAYLRSTGGEIAAAPGGADALIALGKVLDRLEADQLAARDEFAAAFAGFAAKGTRRTVKATFT